MNKNKIIFFVLALILIAGIVMLFWKGFNVSLELRAHDTLKFVFDEKFTKSDIEKICNEVFKDKEYKIKTVEVFSDAIYIISPLINEKEEQALLEKLDKLYKKEEKQEDVEPIEATPENTEEAVESANETIFDKLEKGTKYEIYHDSKVRIRDIVKPYIMPSIISAIIIVIYIAIKYRKLNDGYSLITICKTLGEMLVVLLEVMSIIIITRIPFTRGIIPIIMFIIIIALCIRFSIYEKQLEKIDE